MPAAFELLLIELTDSLRPVVYAAEEEPVGSGLVRLALETGYDLEGLLTEERATEFATAVSTIHSALRTVVSDPDGFVERIPDVLEQVANLYDELNRFDELLPSASDLGVRVLDYAYGTL